MDNKLILRHKTYDQAEEMYRNGQIGEDDWAWYCHVWRNSAFRFSNIEHSEQHVTEAAMKACSICQTEGLTFNPANSPGELEMMDRRSGTWEDGASNL